MVLPELLLPDDPVAVLFTGLTLVSTVELFPVIVPVVGPVVGPVVSPVVSPVVIDEPDETSVPEVELVELEETEKLEEDSVIPELVDTSEVEEGPADVDKVFRDVALELTTVDVEEISVISLVVPGVPDDDPLVLALGPVTGPTVVTTVVKPV